MAKASFSTKRSSRMDQKNLFKNLALSFIPLLVFVAVGEILSRNYGEELADRYALFFAVGAGVVQAAWIFYKEKRLDRLVLLDTGLVISLGGLSFLSGDDIFFKLKPALIEIVVVFFMGGITFLKPNLLLAMAERFRQKDQLGQIPIAFLQRSMGGMLLVLLLHVALTVWAAFCLSRAGWGFISGGLLYIMIGLYFIGMFCHGHLKKKR